MFPDGGPLLKFHLISCIARRLSSTIHDKVHTAAAAAVPAAAPAAALAAAPAADPWIHIFYDEPYLLYLFEVYIKELFCMVCPELTGCG